MRCSGCFRHVAVLYWCFLTESMLCKTCEEPVWRQPYAVEAAR